MNYSYTRIPRAPTAAERAHLHAQTLADDLCADFNDADLADLRDMTVRDLPEKDAFWRKQFEHANPRESRKLRVLILERLTTGAK